MMRIAPRSSMIAREVRNTLSEFGILDPNSDSTPSANAMSVAVGTAQPRQVSGVSKLTAKKMRAGASMPPALIYFAVNYETPETWRGWAVPTATDIAFALGVLSLFGSRIPNSLKVFLTSLAIMDDLGAILIIAIFYASDLSMQALGLAGLATAVLVAFNWFGVKRLAPYLVVGVLLWAATLFSGIHATLAGVVLALTIPLGDTSGGHGAENGNSPLYRLEDALGLGVAFIVVPIFGFANA